MYPGYLFKDFAAVSRRRGPLTQRRFWLLNAINYLIKNIRLILHCKVAAGKILILQNASAFLAQQTAVFFSFDAKSDMQSIIMLLVLLVIKVHICPSSAIFPFKIENLQYVCYDKTDIICKYTIYIH